MKVVKAGYIILDENTPSVLRRIERAGRTCYKSESLITNESSEKFVHNLIQCGHESVIEHVSVSVRIICDRGVSHELVRHRIAAFSQESTRFCNYGKAGEVTFIQPCFWDVNSLEYSRWFQTCAQCERAYLDMLEWGASPQQARSVLPNSLKTEIVVTMNLRQWRHFFKLRALGTAGRPHPQMLEITLPMLEEFKQLMPVVFEDLTV